MASVPLPPGAADDLTAPTRWTAPIFVIGCPRSGTTLLTLMLSSHARLTIPPETRFLVPVWRRLLRFGDLSDPANRARLADEVMARGTKFKHLRLDPDTVRRAITDGAPTIGSAIGAVYRAYAQTQGKVRWGDKQPTYFRNVELLRAMWPDAQFIHLVRDGRDCVASLKRMRWWRHGTIVATATWVHSVDCARRAQARLPASAFTEIRYEDLVSDYPTVLPKLCAFLGEEFDEAMLRPQKLARQLPGKQRRKWHWRTAKYIGPRRVGTHAELLTPRESALIERVAGSRLRSLGYAVPDDPARAPLTDVARFWLALTSMRVRTRLLETSDKMQARLRGPVADQG